MYVRARVPRPPRCAKAACAGRVSVRVRVWAVCGFVCRGCVCWVPGEMFAKLPIKVSTHKNTESGAPAGKHGVVCRLTLGSVQSGGA